MPPDNTCDHVCEEPGESRLNRHPRYWCEGRGWRGFHHPPHSVLPLTALLIAERGAIPPSGSDFSSQLSRSAIPDGGEPSAVASSLSSQKAKARDEARSTSPSMDTRSINEARRDLTADRGDRRGPVPGVRGEVTSGRFD
jgi:hypothetical protein